MFFDHVISREYCTVNPISSNIIKDLSLLTFNRRKNEILIVDNKPENFCLDFNNGIPIKDYYGDKNDEELKYLTQYLLAFRTEKDVRRKVTITAVAFRQLSVEDATIVRVEDIQVQRNNNRLSVAMLVLVDPDGTHQFKFLNEYAPRALLQRAVGDWSGGWGGTRCELRGGRGGV